MTSLMKFHTLQDTTLDMRAPLNNLRELRASVRNLSCFSQRTQRKVLLDAIALPYQPFQQFILVSPFAMHFYP